MATDRFATDILLMLSEVRNRKPFGEPEALEVSTAIGGMLEILNNRRVGRSEEEHTEIVTQLTDIRDMLRPSREGGDARLFYHLVGALDAQLKFIEAMVSFLWPRFRPRAISSADPCRVDIGKRKSSTVSPVRTALQAHTT